VVVTGTWAIESPQGERNTNGLLVYRALEHRPPTAPTAATAATIAAPSGLPEIEVSREVPLRAIIDTDVRNASVQRLNACNRALAARQYDVAITECRAATHAWADNHLAWYGWASAHLAKGEWREAQAAIARAVTLRPDQGMYQLYDGIARYEVERLRAREDQARATRKRPEEVTLAPPIGTLDAARAAMLRAIRLAPELWRARYYLGRIYRDLDDARRAAEQLTQAIALSPKYGPAYVELAELYRRWGYLDHSIAVATLGAVHATTDPAELWFQLAMAHDARHADDQAIAALGKAIAFRPDDASSLLQRGQIYLRKGDAASAKRDLERVTRSADPQTGTARRVATRLLEQLSSRTHAGTARAWDSPRSYKKVYRPADEPYEPWVMFDSKYRCM
jgi:tetratricopeptide (TPR) repeat protein